jgi:hypothetical protein
MPVHSVLCQTTCSHRDTCKQSETSQQTCIQITECSQQSCFTRYRARQRVVEQVSAKYSSLYTMLNTQVYAQKYNVAIRIAAKIRTIASPVRCCHSAQQRATRRFETTLIRLSIITFYPVELTQASQRSVKRTDVGLIDRNLAFKYC